MAFFAPFFSPKFLYHMDFDEEIFKRLMTSKIRDDLIDFCAVAYENNCTMTTNCSLGENNVSV